MIEIRRADEIADFTSHLGEIDDIFFESSARRDFCSQEEKQSFREISLGRYLVNIETASLLPLMTPDASDISQAAFKIRQNLFISMMFRIFGTLRIFAKPTLHIFILI